eukprot:jgi/Psemu1/2092/gm1.2092_g
MNRPNAAEKQGGIPPTTAPLRFVANGLALPSCPKTAGAVLMMIVVAQNDNGNLTVADVMRLVAFPADDCNNNDSIHCGVEPGYHINISSYISPITSTPVDIIADWVARQSSLHLTPEDIISALAAKQQQRDRDREDCTAGKATTTTNTVAINATKKATTSSSNSNSISHTKKKTSIVLNAKPLSNKKNQGRMRRHVTRLANPVTIAERMYREKQGGMWDVNRSDQDICNYANRLNGTSVTVGSLWAHVYQNRCQVNDTNIWRGKPGGLLSGVEDALVTAMETYSNLTSAEMEERPDHLDQIKRLELCMKVSPATLKDHVSLHCRLSAKYPVSVETFIKCGFARLETKEELGNGHKGELTALTLDGTSTNAGGCPVTEYGLSNRSLPCGCGRAQKSSWRCTAVADSTAAGDPIPLHFQLKSNATKKKKRISKSFADELNKSRTCSGVWSIPGATVESPTMMPHTVNCNPAAGIDSVEFHKYFETSIMPLFPDAQPAKGKYLLSRKGILLIAGVPNTTHVTQVMGMSFNPFKTAFCSNNKKLHAYRPANNQTVKTCEIPALIFGHKESATLQLRSAFEEERNVAHEMMTLADGTIDVDADPTTIVFLELERRNRIAVKVLIDSRFNGKVYSKVAPRIMLKNTLAKTQPNTRAHQDALQKSSSAGPRYNYQHIVNERIRHEGNIKVMKETKTKALAYSQKKESAQPLINNCDGNFIDLPVSKLRKVFEWKLQEKSTTSHKQDSGFFWNQAHIWAKLHWSPFVYCKRCYRDSPLITTGYGKQKVTKKKKNPYDFASSLFIRKSKKLEDASQQLGLTNTRNGPHSSGGTLPEVLDNQNMYDPSVKPMERALIVQELVNNEDDNDSVFDDNCFSPNDDNEEEGIDSTEVPPSLSVRSEGNNVDVDDSHRDSNTAITTPNVGRNMSDELKHTISCREELYEWAIKSERLNLFSWTKGNLIKTRSSVVKEISTTVPEIEGDGFEPRLIDWCSKKSKSAEVTGRKQIYVWSFQKALHSLLTNVTLVKEDNLSFLHAEDPILPVRYPELQGNNDINELHHSEWWINTWEKRCKSKLNEILVPIILYMDGIAIDNSGQNTLTPLNMTLGIFNTLTQNSHPDAWEAIYYHPTCPGDKGEESINNHDQLYGHYQTLNSKMICRHCNCPRALGINTRVNVLKVPISVKSGNMQVSNHQNGDEYQSVWLWNISDFTAPTVDKGVNFEQYFKNISHHSVHNSNAFYDLDFGENPHNIHLIL